MTNESSYHCKWCDSLKTLAEMTTPGRTGRPPAYCHSCRLSNPGMSYCEYHEATHSVSEFKRRGPRHLPYKNCAIAVTRISQIKNGEVRKCVECESAKPFGDFPGRGTSSKLTCRDCNNSRPGMKMCPQCREWKSERLFGWSEKRGRATAGSCASCRATSAHGVTADEILAMQGSDKVECASCGRADALHIDHDHSHCSGPRGCRECVRGYLCNWCNVAEGMLKTPERAEALAAYMRKHGIGA